MSWEPQFIASCCHFVFLLHCSGAEPHYLKLDLIHYFFAEKVCKRLQVITYGKKESGNRQVPLQQQLCIYSHQTPCLSQRWGAYAFICEPFRFPSEEGTSKCQWFYSANFWPRTSNFRDTEIKSCYWHGPKQVCESCKPKKNFLSCWCTKLWSCLTSILLGMQVYSTIVLPS